MSKLVRSFITMPVVLIDDTPQVEEALVSQLLASPDLMALIDDFYWEHHVNFEPMVSIWQDGASKSKSMNDSLLLFSALRRAGVRAHSWT